VDNSVARSDEAAWTELEEAFFASAPPDAADPLLELSALDELLPAAPPPGQRRRQMLATGKSVLAAIPPVWRRTAVALSSLVLILALSAGVVASRSGAGTVAGTSPMGSPASGDAARTAFPASPSGPPQARSSTHSRARHHKASKRPPRHHRGSTGATSSSKSSVASAFWHR
jgi:hypothetical protein